MEQLRDYEANAFIKVSLCNFHIVAKSDNYRIRINAKT